MLVDIANENRKRDKRNKLYLYAFLIILLTVITFNVYSENKGVKINITILDKKYSIKQDDKLSEVLTSEKIKFDSNDYITVNENYIKERNLDSYILKEGDNVNIIYVSYKEVTKNEAINYNVKKIKTKTLYVGDIKKETPGSQGVMSVTYKIKYIDQKEVSRERIGSKITKNKVDEVILIGVKVRKEVSNNNDNVAYDKEKEDISSSAASEEVEKVDECTININGTEYKCRS